MTAQEMSEDSYLPTFKNTSKSKKLKISTKSRPVLYNDEPSIDTNFDQNNSHETFRDPQSHLNLSNSNEDPI